MRRGHAHMRHLPNSEGMSSFCSMADAQDECTWNRRPDWRKNISRTEANALRSRIAELESQLRQSQSQSPSALRSPPCLPSFEPPDTTLWDSLVDVAFTADVQPLTSPVAHQSTAPGPAHVSSSVPSTLTTTIPPERRSPSADDLEGYIVS